jgi:hypothetical protein
MQDFLAPLVHRHQLDIFVAGSDGKTYAAAWDQNVSNGQWRGWWNILTGAIPVGGSNQTKPARPASSRQRRRFSFAPEPGNRHATSLVIR